MDKIPATRLRYTTSQGAEGEVVVYLGAPKYRETISHFNKEHALGHIKIYSREDIELESGGFEEDEDTSKWK